MGEGAIGQVPPGYRLVDVPEGTVFEGEPLETFAMTETRVTNHQWQAFVERLGRDVFVKLSHDRRTGETRIEQRGHDVELPRGSKEVDWDAGEVFLAGAYVLLKMAQNPSAQFDEPASDQKPARIFSGEDQPVVGLSYYFHPMAHQLLLNLLAGDGAEWFHTLLTDAQYSYVAINRGNPAWEFPTETGKLFDTDGRKLLHVGEWQEGRGTTAAVNDQRYQQNLLFGIQAGGNVWTPTAFSRTYVPERSQPPARLAKEDDGVIRLAAAIEEEPIHTAAYGLRGGSWGSDRVGARASIRLGGHPWGRRDSVGFSGAAVRARTALRAR